MEFKQSRNDDERTIEHLKRMEKPVMVYGCGQYAEMVCRYLQDKHVNVHGYLIDDAFFKCQKIGGVSTYKYSKLAQLGDIDERYSIVIGFCNVRYLRLLLQKPEWFRFTPFFLWQPHDNPLWDEKYLNENKIYFEHIYTGLADDKSRIVLNSVINANLNRSLLDVMNCVDDVQYFNELTYRHSTDKEIYVDCGAFNGDTVLDYDSFTDGNYSRIFAFEPNRENIDLLRRRTDSMHDVHIIPKATWNRSGSLEFILDTSGSTIVGTDLTRQGRIEKIKVTMIDEELAGICPTFIKMDVEGSEVETLQGAEHTIRQSMPTLAVCVYHKREDLVNIYKFLEGIREQGKYYKIYLRQYAFNSSETVLYGIPTAY